MTDNIFEIETTALAHVACAPRLAGILLTDFAAAYPSVNHSWIFHVLERVEFIFLFLRRIYCESTTQVEFAGVTRGLGPDLVGILSISLAVRYRTAACSNTLSQGLEKIQAAREYDFAPVLALSSIWEKEFLTPSRVRSTADAFNIVRCLDHKGKLDESPQDKKQKAATPCSATNYTGRTLLDRSPCGPPGFLDRSVAFALWRFCLT